VKVAVFIFLFVTTVPRVTRPCSCLAPTDPKSDMALYQFVFQGRVIDEDTHGSIGCGGDEPVTQTSRFSVSLFNAI